MLAKILIGASITSWVVVYLSSFMIKHFELLGWQQCYGCAWWQWGWTGVSE